MEVTWELNGHTNMYIKSSRWFSFFEFGEKQNIELLGLWFGNLIKKKIKKTYSAGVILYGPLIYTIIQLFCFSCSSILKLNKVETYIEYDRFMNKFALLDTFFFFLFLEEIFDCPKLWAQRGGTYQR